MYIHIAISSSDLKSSSSINSMDLLSTQKVNQNDDKLEEDKLDCSGGDNTSSFNPRSSLLYTQSDANVDVDVDANGNMMHM